MNLADAHVLVLGRGVTGEAVVECLEARGIAYTTVDAHAPADFSRVADIDCSDYDIAVVSPGWPPSGPDIAALQHAGVPVWSEVELAWQIRDPDTAWIVVTGTNGKTSTVEILGAIAREAQMSHAVVGNVGTPVVREAAAGHELLIVEASSFQLHFTHSMKPHASVILNIADDHLDWHGSFAEYRRAKARVYKDTAVAAVYPADDPMIEQCVRDADVQEGCRAIGYSVGPPAVSQLGVVEDLLVDRAFGQERRSTAIEIGNLVDVHSTTKNPPGYAVRNALAAAALARSVGITPESVAAGIRAFRPGKHRGEIVAARDGVTYINNSKATNPHAARATFEAHSEASVVWIAGGLAKGARYDDLVTAVASQLRAVILIGEDSSELSGALARHAPAIPLTRIKPGKTVMVRAVAAAADSARAGDTVLMCPASASMDQFDGYHDRGEKFSQAVEALAR